MFIFSTCRFIYLFNGSNFGCFRLWSSWASELSSLITNTVKWICNLENTLFDWFIHQSFCWAPKRCAGCWRKREGGRVSVLPSHSSCGCGSSSGFNPFLLFWSPLRALTPLTTCTDRQTHTHWHSWLDKVCAGCGMCIETETKSVGFAFTWKLEAWFQVLRGEFT